MALHIALELEITKKLKVSDYSLIYSIYYHSLYTLVHFGPDANFKFIFILLKVANFASRKRLWIAVDAAIHFIFVTTGGSFHHLVQYLF